MAIDLATYGGNTLPVGFPGAVVDGNPTTIVSRINSGATAIDFGVAVARASADDTVAAIAADGDKISGISGRLATKASSAGVVNYAQYDSVPVIKTGFVYATAYENVVRGDGVISVTAQAGKLSGTTAGAAGTGRVAVTGAVWETTTAAGSVGIVRINA